MKVKIRPARALLFLTAETFLRLLGCVLPRQPSVAHHRARFVFRDEKSSSEVAGISDENAADASTSLEIVRRFATKDDRIIDD